MVNKISNSLNELASRAVLVGGAYGAACLTLGKDAAWRAISYIPTIGADLTEACLESLVGANFVSPLSKEALIKARYIGSVSSALLAFWKGPEVVVGSVSNLQILSGKRLMRPFTIKEHWYNHPDRILLTKQQAAALGATLIVAAALVAGPERTSRAVEMLSNVPSNAADHVLSALNISKEGWFSSNTTPLWAKWVAGVPLVAGGWWAVNTAFSGVLYGVNRVLKGVQTPTKGHSLGDIVSEQYAKIRKMDEEYEKEKKRRKEYQSFATKLVNSLAPALQGRFEELSNNVLALLKLEQKPEEKQ